MNSVIRKKMKISSYKRCISTQMNKGVFFLFSVAGGSGGKRVGAGDFMAKD